MNQRKRNKIAQPYINAAKLVSGKFSVDIIMFTKGCCESIALSTFHYDRLELDYLGLFRKIFGKHKQEQHYWWPIALTTSTNKYESRRQQKEVTPRIIALCLMAELVKDGQFDDQIGNLPY